MADIRKIVGPPSLDIFYPPDPSKQVHFSWSTTEEGEIYWCQFYLWQVNNLFTPEEVVHRNIYAPAVPKYEISDEEAERDMMTKVVIKHWENVKLFDLPILTLPTNPEKAVRFAWGASEKGLVYWSELYVWQREKGLSKYISPRQGLSGSAELLTVSMLGEA